MRINYKPLCKNIQTIHYCSLLRLTPLALFNFTFPIDPRNFISFRGSVHFANKDGVHDPAGTATLNTSLPIYSQKPEEVCFPYCSCWHTFYLISEWSSCQPQKEGVSLHSKDVFWKQRWTIEGGFSVNRLCCVKLFIGQTSYIGTWNMV